MAKIDMVCPRYSETHGVIRNGHSASGASYSACWDNAVIEHFWGYLKHEWLLLVPQPTRSYMKQDAAAYIRLFHQLTGQPASHFDTRVSGDDSRDASSAGRAAAGVPGFHDLAALSDVLTIVLTVRSLPACSCCDGLQKSGTTQPPDIVLSACRLP